MPIDDITSSPFDASLDVSEDGNLVQDRSQASPLIAEDKSQQDDRPIDPPPDLASRQARLAKAQNPLLEAARPLLRILSEMPHDSPGGVLFMKQFHATLQAEVRHFQRLCDGANLRREHMLTARYCLCTAIDEAAGGTAWGQGGAWGRIGLAQHFHGDTEGGTKFFLLAARLLHSPDEHIDLLELMYRILGLGFRGMYHGDGETERQLEGVRHRLLTALTAIRGAVDPVLAPHWQGERSNKRAFFYSIPVWASVCLFSLILLSVYSWKEYHLLKETDALVAEIAATARLMPPPIKGLRLAELLKDEIAAKRVAVSDSDRQSSVLFHGDDMFQPGRAVVSKPALATLKRLADEVSKVPGQVSVTGHSDSQPIRSKAFASNQVLSEKRAASVAQQLIQMGVDAKRLSVLGKGDTEPVADNKTAEGRSRNRRVEILVTQ